MTEGISCIVASYHMDLFSQTKYIVMQWKSTAAAIDQEPAGSEKKKDYLTRETFVGRSVV